MLVVVIFEDMEEGVRWLRSRGAAQEVAIWDDMSRPEAEAPMTRVLRLVYEWGLRYVLEWLVLSG